MCTIKLREKIFPKTEEINKLLYDTEGLYSISHPDVADKISQFMKDNIKTDNIVIFDGTAGLGGNLLSFAKNFKFVYGIELDNNRFKMLETNVSCYKYNNIKLLNGNCIDFLDGEYDVYFFDPPWGGPEYKNYSTVDLFLGYHNLLDIVKKLPKNKHVIFKVPYNYNINLLKDYDLNIKKINNMLIIYLIS
jgi:predicted RNA methylase